MYYNSNYTSDSNSLPWQCCDRSKIGGLYVPLLTFTLCALQEEGG